MRAANARLARLTHDIPLPKATGLEIGAASHPLLFPAEFEIRYVDFERSEATQLPCGADIDIVWPGAGALADAIARDVGRPDAGEQVGSYDFAVASQVAQYVPNLLGWFAGIFAVLRVGGVLNLSLPDRRFTFDIGRKPSTLGEAVEAFLLDYAKPSLRQVFDHTYGAMALEPARLWSEPLRVEDLPRFCGEHALELAHANVTRVRDSGAYVLCHCWVFTPLSFLDLIEGATRLGLFPFVMNQFSATEPGSFEFFASFRRDGETDPPRLRTIQLAAIHHLRAIVERRRRTAELFAAP